MPNMRDAPLSQSYLLVGPGGSGKTTQFKTMPGRKFAWVFDPNAFAALSGLDIEYFDGVPDAVGRSVEAGAIGVGIDTSVEVYNRLWLDMRQRLKDGFFAGIDSLLIDGLTGLASVIEEYVLSAILRKPGGEIVKREAMYIHKELQRFLRQVAALNKNLLLCAHRDTIMDPSGTKMAGAQISVIGQSRVKVPIHFANVLYTVAEGGTKETVYSAFTKPSALTGDPRMSDALSHLPFKIDMTIRDFAHPENYGIGWLITESKKRKAEANGPLPTA